MATIGQLITQLNLTGLQNSNPPLYQFLLGLIKSSISSSSSSSSSSTTVNNVTNNNQINQSVQLMLENDEYEENYGILNIPVPGSTGATGAQGPTGPVILGSDGEDGEGIIQVFQTISGGSSYIAQIVNSESGAVATGTTVIPFDNTIPQNTEGTQFLSVSITPKSATSTLQIDVTIFASATTTPWIIVALFQDSTADALASVATFVNLSTTGATITFRHTMTSGTTSSTTFKVRAGPSGVATLTVNGQSGGRIFGGVAASSITVTEYGS